MPARLKETMRSILQELKLHFTCLEPEPDTMESGSRGFRLSKHFSWLFNPCLGTAKGSIAARSAGFLPIANTTLWHFFLDSRIVLFLTLFLMILRKHFSQSDHGMDKPQKIVTTTERITCFAGGLSLPAFRKSQTCISIQEKICRSLQRRPGGHENASLLFMQTY